jgi:hypothetical protein
VYDILHKHLSNGEGKMENQAEISQVIINSWMWKMVRQNQDYGQTVMYRLSVADGEHEVCGDVVDWSVALMLRQAGIELQIPNGIKKVDVTLDHFMTCYEKGAFFIDRRQHERTLKAGFKSCFSANHCNSGGVIV